MSGLGRHRAEAGRTGVRTDTEKREMRTGRETGVPRPVAVPAGPRQRASVMRCVKRTVSPDAGRISATTT